MQSKRLFRLELRNVRSAKRCVGVILAFLAVIVAAAYLIDLSHRSEHDPRTLAVFAGLFATLALFHALFLLPLLRKIETDSRELDRRFETTESSYRSVFESHPLPILVYDDDTRRIRDANPAAESDFGWSREELRSMRMDDLRPTAEPKKQEDVLGSDVPTGPRGGVRIHRRRDGTCFEAEVFCSPLREAGDERISIVADVTEREQALRRLEREEAWLDGITQSLSEGVIVSDLDGSIAFANRRAEELTGRRMEDVVGRQVEEFLSPHDADLSIRLESRAHGVSESYVQLLEHPDGREIYLEVHAAPLRDTDGTVCGVVASFSDVSTRLEAEATLRRRERELRTLFQQVPARLWSTDRELRITSIAGVGTGLGYETKDLVGRPLDELVADGLAEEAIEVHQKALEGEPGTYEMDLGTVVFEVRVEPLRDERSEVVGTVGLGLDVTEMVRTQKERDELGKQLLQAQKMEAIGRLAGGVAHDFNNLLSAIIGWTELLESQLDGQGREEIGEILSAARTAGSVTHQLLAFSRQEAREPRLLKLDETLAETEKLLRRVIGEEVELATDLGCPEAQVAFDPAQLQQVLLNLAVNAHDAMAEGGSLEIRTRTLELDPSASGSGLPRPVIRRDATAAPMETGAGARDELLSRTDCWYRIDVRDTGHGMGPETLENIFDPFYTTKERGRGTGLGLSTVFGIMDQNGGHISVESRLGEGTTFSLLLPAADELSVFSTAEPPEVVTVEGSPKILMVEDEAALRIPLSRGLRRRGFEVFDASNPHEALKIFDAEGPESFDLLVTDVVMPGCFGDILAAEMQELHPGLRVLYISGYPDDRFADRPTCEAVLAKPFGLDEIQARIQQILAGPTDAPPESQEMSSLPSSRA